MTGQVLTLGEAMQAFVAAVLLGCARLDALGEETQADPLGGEL
jgi:hypothetical protein